MTPLSIQVPFPVFQDRDGQPLDNGYVWIGVPNLSPQVNPVNVYFDEALTQPAAQPLRTINGYISNAGTPAQIYIDGVNFSILVQDSKGSMVYNFPDGTGIGPDACGVTYNPPFTGAVSYPVCQKLAQTVSVKDFGATGDGSTDDFDSIETAFNYCVANGYSLYFPAGIYNVVDKNFPFNQGLPVTALKDCNNVTVYGDGPTSILKTTSSAGADVLQLNGVKNLHFRNLKVTAVLTGFAGAGSNGISITNGWDNITIRDVWIEDCPYVDKGSYLDGGKGLTIQPGTPTVECGSLYASVFTKNTAYGVDLAWDLLNAATKKPAIMIDAQIEKSYIGVVFGDAGGSNTGLDEGFSLNYMVRAQTVNCQRDAVINRGFGLDWDINVVANQDAANLRLNPSGGTWASNNTVESLRCQYAKNSKIFVHGYKPEQDIKAAIGDTVNIGFGGDTENCDILVDVGGSAVNPVIAPTFGAGYVQNCVMRFTTKTCAASEIPAIFYFPTLNNTVVYGAYHHFTGMQVTGPIEFSYTDGITTYNSVERDGAGMFFKQTLSGNNNIQVLGVKKSSGVTSFAIRQDGAIATSFSASAATISGLTNAYAIYDTSGAFIGWIPIYSTIT